MTRWLLVIVIIVGSVRIWIEWERCHPPPPAPPKPLEMRNLTEMSRWSSTKDEAIIILDNCIEFEKDRTRPMDKCKVKLERVEF